MIAAKKNGAAFVLLLAVPTTAGANAYREKGKSAEVVDASVVVTPSRDWNRLDIRPGKRAETWTLDGELLNDVTFYVGVQPGEPLVKERSKKHDPLPKLTPNLLLAEVPELLERTYRTYKHIGTFTLTDTKEDNFLGRSGIHFTYDYLDQDQLPRKGEARAVLVNRALYMVTFDAPRLNYFDKAITDYRALADAAALVTK